MPLSVVHYTVDLDNASCGLTFSADRAAYSGNLLLNHPAPGQIKPGMSAITRKRWVSPHLPQAQCSWHASPPALRRRAEHRMQNGCTELSCSLDQCSLIYMCVLVDIILPCLQGAGQDDNGVHADGRASGEGQVSLGRLHCLAHAWRRRPGAHSHHTLQCSRSQQHISHTGCNLSCACCKAYWTFIVQLARALGRIHLFPKACCLLCLAAKRSILSI